LCDGDYICYRLRREVGVGTENKAYCRGKTPQVVSDNRSDVGDLSLLRVGQYLGGPVLAGLARLTLRGSQQHEGGLGGAFWSAIVFVKPCAKLCSRTREDVKSGNAKFQKELVRQALEEFGL